MGCRSVQFNAGPFAGLACFIQSSLHPKVRLQETSRKTAGSGEGTHPMPELTQPRYTKRRYAGPSSGLLCVLYKWMSRPLSRKKAAPADGNRPVHGFSAHLSAMRCPATRDDAPLWKYSTFSIKFVKKNGGSRRSRTRPIRRRDLLNQNEPGGSPVLNTPTDQTEGFTLISYIKLCQEKRRTSFGNPPRA